MVRPYLKEYVYYKEAVGPDSMHIRGIPGTGKSNIGYKILYDCLMHKKKPEIALLVGDRHCEWRHFLNYPEIADEITVLIPEKASIHMEKIPKIVKDMMLAVDFDELNIRQYLKAGQPTVVYDHCYDMASRSMLWVEIIEQLLERTEKDLINTVVSHLDHEAGTRWPQIALKQRGQLVKRNHWLAVHLFAEFFVEARKADIRCIFLSQLDSELNHLVRDKCMWEVLRQGRAGGRSPRQVRKASPLQALHNYIVMVGGGLYCRENTVPEFREIKTKWKMIAQRPYLTYHRPYEQEAFRDKVDEYILDAFDSLDLYTAGRRLAGDSLVTIADKVSHSFGRQISYQAIQHRIKKIIRKSAKLPELTTTMT